MSSRCSRPVTRFLTSLLLPVAALFSAQCASAQEVVAAPEVSGKVYDCKAGPWGQLKYYYIYLEAPVQFTAKFPMPNSVTKWCFEGLTEPDLRALFTRAGLPHALQQYLLEPKRTVVENGILTVFPPLPDLEAMTPTQREVIYGELAKSDLNEYHKNPVLITANNVTEWLQGTKLSPELLEVIPKFTYRRGNILAFSDLSAVLNYAKTDKEAQDFFKTVTRTRTMILRLSVDENTDIQQLAAYWTGRNRYKDIEPILQSAKETESVALIDIIHLLPSMARRYLYTYPPMELAIMGRMPDCHWTSLNFFNHYARQYFLDTRLAADHVLNSYDRVPAPYEFGDVLMFLDVHGQAIHSCVYIADDIVFTKNGENLVSPWLLMKLDDVKSIYFPVNEGSVQGFRMKPPGAESAK
ncbi:hypothetical protein [Verrucomicrobium sp. BvORR106]|uniref:hypothetical protein n=1 Tax=Verrucomicrobium sp. BvORR106 TaxID=1403819 RepID=UPI00056EC95F|nr:hypothetical protein [Verrucomicrobium sp. BvORR106]